MNESQRARYEAARVERHKADLNMRRLMERRYGVRQLAAALINSGMPHETANDRLDVVERALKVNAMIEEAIRA